MAKAEEKEFKRRLGKMGKHVDALYQLAKAADQKTCLDEIGQKINWLSSSMKGYGVKAAG